MTNNYHRLELAEKRSDILFLYNRLWEKCKTEKKLSINFIFSAYWEKMGITLFQLAEFLGPGHRTPVGA
jgi:hypothetical protein